MALYTVKEFAEKFNKGTNYISVLVSRRKKGQSGIELTESGLIDDANEYNAAWISKQSEEPTTKNVVVTTNIVEEVPTEEVTGTKKPKQKNKITENEAPVDINNLESLNITQLDKQKKIVELKKKHEDLERTKLLNAKMKGEVIPFGLMKPIVAQNNQSITTAYKNAADALIVEIVKRCDLSITEAAELKKHLVETINLAVKEATDTSIKNIEIIVEDYKTSAVLK